MMFVKILLAVCMYIGGYGGLSDSGLCVFSELCPVSFLVIGECPSVLLYSVVMWYVNYGDDSAC